MTQDAQERTAIHRHPVDNEPQPPLWRNPLLFPIVATIALFVAISFSAPLTFTRFKAMSPERKVVVLERFLSQQEDIELPNIHPHLRTAHGDNPQIILAGATDEDPEVRRAGLKALENLLMVMRAAVDFGDSTMPYISPEMQQSIDELALTGIRAPHGDHFDEYKKVIMQLMTEGDTYHTAVLEVIDTSDENLVKAQLWFDLFFTLGPQADAKPFILQALNADSAPRVISFASNLAQGLLDPDFIAPLAAIATNTELPHPPRHHALSTLARYGAQAKGVLPQLQGLPQEAGWKEDGDEDGDEYCREDAARSIREIETDTPRPTIYLTRPDGTPWRNITPLW